MALSALDQNLHSASYLLKLSNMIYARAPTAVFKPLQIHGSEIYITWRDKRDPKLYIVFPLVNILSRFYLSL